MMRARGFTLIEVLVALALLGLTAVMAYRGIASLVDGDAQLAAEAQRWRTLDAALSRLEADLRQAIPRPAQAGATREPAWLAATEAGGTSGLVFSRAGAEFDAEPGVAGQRIGYRVRNGALEVVYWPALDRPRAGEADARAWALVEGIAGFRVEHLDERGRWGPAWPQPDEPAVPRAVRVHLTLASGETIERWFALR